LPIQDPNLLSATAIDPSSETYAGGCTLTTSSLGFSAAEAVSFFHFVFIRGRTTKALIQA